MEYLSCPQIIAIPQMFFLGTGFFVPSGGRRKIPFKNIGMQATETTGFENELENYGWLPKHGSKKLCPT